MMEWTVPMGDTLQLRDDEIMEAQKQSRFMKILLELGVYHGMKIETRYGLVTVKTKSGWRDGAATNPLVSGV
ncbi:hypothetical protein PHMEG_00021621 [Phytophthora megakarya]|uniref:Uncharacterized protein n=1 Tax=Phytophthora megakarya TaxID=4795 RepID=A0A225VLE1_9STRA|nr:hypothetical protein PHMEG_00021621 [Phytophthora megakarya]